MKESVGFLLSDTARLMRKRFDCYARSLGVTRAQWQVLVTLSRTEGINQAGLADRLEVESITLGRIVDRLEEAGLVERRADPADRRMWRLYLTPKAGPVLEQLRALGNRLQLEVVAGLSEAELNQFEAILMRLRANLSAKPAEAEQARAEQ